MRQERKFERLFDEGQIKGMKLKNRIFMPAMGTRLASERGGVTEDQIAYYVERAKGGVGLIVVEVTWVSTPPEKGMVNNLRIDGDQFIPGFSNLVEKVKRHGTKIALQIFHPGRQGGGPFRVAPSAIPCKLANIVPKQLTIEEIETLIQEFGDAARRAKIAGFDAVEIHGGHGYLVNQFLSPYTNKREDRFGGSFEKRLKFAIDVIKNIRVKVGNDYPLGFRLSAEEYVPGGLTLDDSREIARELEYAGIDYISVSAGIAETFGWIIQSMIKPQGCLLYLAEAIKKKVSIPVVTVGCIRDPGFANNILKEKKADFVAIGRGLIADPYWPEKAYYGKEDEILRCISCMYCISNRCLSNLPIRCTVNPSVGREREFAITQPVHKKKRVIVVGSGPAGMEAARVAAQRGHQVTLYEQKEELGGLLRVAAIPPGKEKIDWLLNYQISELAKSKIKILLKKKVTLEQLKGTKPDVVIVATGSRAIVPEIPGIQSKKVVTAHDLLKGRKGIAGKKVVIAGGGMVGCESAMFLSDSNKELDITIIEMLENIATDIEFIYRGEILQELYKRKVKIFTKFKLLEVIEEGIEGEDKDGNLKILECDHIILALGAKSINPFPEIEKEFAEVYVIGDAKNPRRIVDAIYEGSTIARLI